ncbi:MAG: glycosyltransferase [Thermodesulfovibrionales bacterium]|nr:glycosyltransferase [Thermodesulfovibrionales bacterium]
MKIIGALIIGFNYFVGIYYGVFNLLYSVLLSISIAVIIKYIKKLKYAPVKEINYSPETPPVSILIAAYNEKDVILRTLESVFSINYPFYDVIVINDGSDDGTLDLLINKFNLRKIDMVYRDILKTAPVKAFYYNPEMPNFLVIDKVRGGKADSLNCGINVSRSPYVCTVDADSVLEPDALIRLMIPVIESTVPVVACGGVVRVLNGSRVERGIVREVSLPDKGLIIFQIVEYLRAFLFGRVGWDALQSILILSGTFSLFNKNAVISAGGFHTKHLAEDMEIIVRLHEYHRRNKKPYRIKFISDPICWTEVPETVQALARQRRRWHMGLMQTLIENRKMIFNPYYGRIGLFVFPYYLIFEMFGPVVEFLGYLVVPLSYILGMLSTEYFLLFLLLAIVYGIFLSTTGVFLEELTYRRYPGWDHLVRLLLYGVLENFGYRQLNSFFRFQATLYYFFRERRWEHVRK